MKKIALPEFKISLKKRGSVSEVFTVTSTEEAAKFCRACFDDGKIEWIEEFIVIALSRSNDVLGFYKVSTGGVSGTVVDPKVIFQFALLSNASGIIVSHNHPSGNLKPSDSDVRITRKLDDAAESLDIKLLDHIIISTSVHFSFKEEGII